MTKQEEISKKIDDLLWAKCLGDTAKIRNQILSIAMEPIKEEIGEIVRILGKVVPHDQNKMIEWAVNSQDAVYTNAGAAYRLTLELKRGISEWT